MKRFVRNKYWNIAKEYNKEKLLYLLIDRPTQITYNDDFVWKNNKNQVHRGYDLPAVIWENEINVAWYKNNKLHRENHIPAHIWYDGYKEYWLNGFKIL